MPSRLPLRWKISRKAMLCPKCLSLLKLAGPFSGWLLPASYLCPKCGYSGPVALEGTERDEE